MKFSHKIFETKPLILVIGILITVSIGGIIEIAPLFYLESTIEKVKGVRPYTPLELKGRNIYIREGCYLCHSQMIRSLRDEVDRYGHYSLAAESMYDHPFQWGSKRTGPDLARVGNRYSNEWHVEHMINPRALVPESVMPGYPFLATTPLRLDDIADHLKANRAVGVPYSDDMIKNAKQDLITQAMPEQGDVEALQKRYPGARANVFDLNPKNITEMDAMIAYLQVLGTMVDLKSFKAEGDNLR